MKWGNFKSCRCNAEYCSRLNSVCKDPEKVPAWVEWDVKIWRGDGGCFLYGTKDQGKYDEFY